jgi:hypothetical protein
MKTRNLYDVLRVISEGTRVALIRYGALVILIALIAAATFSVPAASTGNLNTFVPTALGPTDFLVSDAMGSHIAVFDSNLVFKGFFDENLSVMSFRGLDFLPNQHIVGLSLTSPPTVTEYDTSGTHISSFMSMDLHGDPVDLKSNKASMPADFRLYFGQDCCAMGASAPELNLSGTKIRGFGSNTYDGIAVLPGNVMWAGGLGLTSKIDVFNIASGSGTGGSIAPTSTINLDNMQVNVSSLSYSAVTDTVLMVEPGNSIVFERMTDGTFVRKFVAPMGVSLTFGVTRGPGNDVFASGISGVFNGRIVRWHSDGTFVSTTDISAEVFDPMNIIWAGNSTAGCTLTCPGNQMANTGPGATMCCAAVTFLDPMTSGACGTVTCNPVSGSCFPVGTTTVTCSDPSGANCSFTVTVTDNTPPKINCPADMIALQDSASGAVVNFAPPTATDNCPGVLTTCTPASGSVFPFGTTTVTCTATDAGGNGASCSFKVTVVPPPTAGGSFVIGDLNAVVGSQVTFWGAQWAKSNSLSGGPAPASFKGFAQSVGANLPACGAAWTTDPGNSSGPPASIPSYIAVIASSSITKSGPTIAGNTQQVMIVKTNPGYASNPGHAGTGTVVAVICP